jgi:hypothetical protein
MQRKLNLNELSGKVLVAVGVLLVAIPLILFAALLLLQAVGVPAATFRMLIGLSFSLGILLAATFGVLAIAEQVQDHRYAQNYGRQKDRKIKLANGCYECQHCGNRQVGASDRFCQVCGKGLR